jgi:hypothetical protein
MPTFLDYAASQEDAINTYRASGIRLAIHNNTSYLAEPKVCSRAGGHMFMAGNEDIPINNGAVLNILQIIRAVMSLAAGTVHQRQIGSLYATHPQKIRHPQTCTPIQTNNSTAHALLTNKIMPKALKAMYMRFY